MPLNHKYNVAAPIDVDAANPLDAAQKALAAIWEDGHVFTYIVTDDQGQEFAVDLLTGEVKTN